MPPPAAGALAPGGVAIGGSAARGAMAVGAGVAGGRAARGAMAIGAGDGDAVVVGGRAARGAMATGAGALAAASTLTASFMPPSQWPGTPQMK